MVALQRGVSVPKWFRLECVYIESTASLLYIEHESPSLGHMCDVEDDDQRCSVLSEPAAVAYASFPPPASSDGFSFLRQHQSAVS